jgi:hypothetical protein
MPRQRRACRRHGVIQSSAHRFLDECADLGLFGGGNFTSAKAVGHMAPSSRFAETLVRDARVCQGRQGRLLLPTGPLALMIAWSRSPRARSGSGIAAIVASTALSPSALSARGPGRAAAFFAACLVVLLALRPLSVI